MRIRVLATMLALAATASLTAAPAAAAHSERWPSSQFVLSIDYPEEWPTKPRRTTLTCDPDGGKHPTPEAACAQLARVRGRIDRLPSDDGPCTTEYNPTRLRAWGHWRGWPRYFNETYSNPCEAIRLTGRVIFAY